jgi:hypothetical protein
VGKKAGTCFLEVYFDGVTIVLYYGSCCRFLFFCGVGFCTYVAGNIDYIIPHVL